MRRSGAERWAAAAAVLVACAGLAACTVPSGQATSSQPTAGQTTTATIVAPPPGVPLVPGEATVLSSALVGEFSRFPQGRWELRVLAVPEAHGPLPIEAARQALRRAGFEPEGRGRPRTSAGSELWMSRAGTVVHVRSTRGAPGLLEYSVTRAYEPAGGAQ